MRKPYEDKMINRFEDIDSYLLSTTAVGVWLDWAWETLF
jgi:hypothetical protein